MQRKRLEDLAYLVGFSILAGVMIASVRPRLFAEHKRVKNRHDVYFLPPPEHVVTLSLGFKAAVADVLWAHVLVSQGLHTFEQRRFESLTRLYDTINLLDPTWRSPYLLADALITFQAAETPLEEVVKTRHILERGVKARPFDGAIWLNLGQFVSFVAPASYIEDQDPELAARWRLEGVPYLQRAAELGSSNSNISWQALGGASILVKAGERDAAISFLRRTYAVTDDQELKDDILRRLQKLIAERDLERYRERERAFTDLYRRELPFIKRDEALLLGPAPHPGSCAGLDHDEEPRCSVTWRAWSSRFDASTEP
jgi:hypothetical protein